MICVSIAQESRRFAPVDMLNAGRQCDLLEIQLDAFAKAPNIAELLADRPKPVIVSCRRPRDGGQWSGTEDERLALLRQCIIDKADYVEIELDVADKIRRYPPARRVISYTNLSETPDDLEDIYAEARSKDPDVIKLTTLTRTPEEAWPLIQILSRQDVPTVVTGLGRPSVMLAVLSKKMRAPWAYAALERGMETYPGQPTVGDLRGAYSYYEIDERTRFIGVTGFGERDRASAAALNAAFAHLNLHARCLPLGVGEVRTFRKVIDVLRLAGVVVDAENRQSILEITQELDEAAGLARATDLILRVNDAWNGCNTGISAAVNALLATLKAKAPDRPIAGRIVLIVGTDSTARAIGKGVQQRGYDLVFADGDTDACRAAAHDLGCRGIRLESLYTTPHDALVVCDEEKRGDPRQPASSVHPGYLRPDMIVMHRSASLHKSLLIRAAEARGCAVVTSYQLWLDQVGAQCRRLTKKDVPREILARAAPWLLDDD